MTTKYTLPDTPTLEIALRWAVSDDYAQQYIYQHAAAYISERTLTRQGIVLALNMAFCDACKFRDLPPVILSALLMSEDYYADTIIAVSTPQEG